MSAFSLVCSIGSLRTKENSGTFSVKPRHVTRYSAAFSHYLIPSVQLCKTQQFSPCTKKLVRSASSENNGVRLLGFGLGYRSWHGFSCSNRIGPLVSSNNGVEPTQLRKGISKLRKRFSLRLRPRLRLLTMRMKRIRVRSVLSEFILFLKKNLRRVVLYASISIGLAMCYLFLRLAAEPSSKIVPYSDFIACLQNGSVSEVLLVEESRGIYYNIDSQGTLINPNSDDQSLSTAVSNEYVGSSVAVEGIALEDQSKAVAVSNGNTAGSVVVEAVAAPQTSRVNQFGKVLKPRESKPKWEFATRKMDHDDKFLLSLLREKGATYRSAPQSVWMSMSGLLLTIIALWIPLTPLMWLLHRQLSANNSLAKKRRPTNRFVTFNDVDGVDAAKVELIEIVSCLQGAIKYQRLGAKLPRGVLLVGPPGTGKTLLARAVAGEAGVPFFSVSASEFVELFVGRGAARIRDLFNTARKSAPSIIFIDELDAVGGRRGRSFNDERDQTLNQLLTEMDGFESEMRVVVIAATNRPEALDPALCRPGRFSRKVLVGEPDEEGRRKILAIHLREVPLEEDPDLISDLVASLTPGLVGADLANIVNEAALLAARRGGESVAREDVMEAIERAKFGINDKKLRPSTISKEIGKLFPWVLPSLVVKKQDDTQGPLGYPTMS